SLRSQLIGITLSHRKNSSRRAVPLVGSTGREGRMIQRLLITILIASICAEVRATTADFNALAAGTNYPAPALFSNGGLDFDVLLGNVNVATASGLINPSFTGNYLNITATSDLNVNLPTGASQIQFDFIENDSQVAYFINGGWLFDSQIPAT